MCSSSQAAGGDSKHPSSSGVATLQHDLYAAVSAASSWLDAAENQLLSGPVLFSEDTETQLTNLEVSEKFFSKKEQSSIIQHFYTTNCNPLISFPLCLILSTVISQSLIIFLENSSVLLFIQILYGLSLRSTFSDEGSTYSLQVSLT